MLKQEDYNPCIIEKYMGDITKNWQNKTNGVPKKD